MSGCSPAPTSKSSPLLVELTWGLPALRRPLRLSQPVQLPVRLTPLPLFPMEGRNELQFCFFLAGPQPGYISQGTVLYDYKAQRSDEISLSTNDKVSLLEKTPEGWGKGDTSTGTGWFPLNYIREEPLTPPSDLEGSKPSPPPPVIGLSPAARMAMAAKTGGGPPPVGPSPASKKPETPSVPPKIPPKIPTKKALRRTTLVGDTWTGMVGQRSSAFTVEERKRQEGIFEIVQTEEIYMKKLGVLLNVFYPVFAQRLPPDDVKMIFSTIPAIFEVNKKILADFEQRQMESNYVVERIGDVFLKHVGALEPYLPYCSNQFRSSAFFGNLLRNDPKFATEIKLLYQDASFRALNGITLEAFLLEPMQRLTRYPILLKTVIHYTPKTHEDHENLVQASIKLEELVSKTNEAARNESDSIKLTELQGKIDLAGFGEEIKLTSETRSLGPRRFLFDGSLLKAKSGRKLQAFLFNDMLLLTEHHSTLGSYEYSVYREPIPVHVLLVREMKNEPPDSLNFEILHIKTQQIIAVRAPSLNDKRRWLREIDGAYTHYQNVLKKQKNPSSKAAQYIGTLQVTVIEARSLSPETGAKCDPYCQVEVEEQAQKTKVVTKSVNPRWGSHLFFSVSNLDQE